MDDRWQGGQEDPAKPAAQTQGQRAAVVRGDSSTPAVLLVQTPDAAAV